jgi:SAM-dependent methyltransferase
MNTALAKRDAAPLLAPPVVNPLRSRFNAWFFDYMDQTLHEKLGAAKARLFAGLPSQVVEIGAGTGANLRYYAPGTRVIAVEPNVHMHDALRRRADELGIEVVVQTCGAEATELPSGSVAAVVSTLVLCSVQDPVAVLREVTRVLAPGGRFVCLEHVAAPSSTTLGRLQRAIRVPWRWVFEGCDLCRDLATPILAAGFRAVSIESPELPEVLAPIRKQIHVVATR